jgi:hypothetical protein
MLLIEDMKSLSPLSVDSTVTYKFVHAISALVVTPDDTAHSLPAILTRTLGEAAGALALGAAIANDVG